MSSPKNAGWTSIRRRLKKINGMQVVKPKSLLLRSDARIALPQFPDSSIDCIITSPPYVCRKDYGTSKQIGFGQDCEAEYLPDLQRILSELFRIAKPGAALWMVIDTVKEAGQTVPLPLDVITRALHSGWTFHDLIVWDKGKNLPWSNPGRFRGVCEYILLFSKGKLTKFNLNAARDSDHLSSYWVKYPERYHPDGKAPTDLWHFPIPNQGGWSKGQTRHYCPFPIGLVARMISITTKIGDVVLDPFSGTGSVIAVASHMGRRGIGIEINSQFVNEYKKTGYDILIKRAKLELPLKGSNKNSLRNTIIELRMLKYAKTLFAQISRSDRLNGTARTSVGAFLLRSAARTKRSNTANLDSNDLGRIKLEVLLLPEANEALVMSTIKDRIAVKPLSLFGVRAQIKIVPFHIWNRRLAITKSQTSKWYVYRSGRFYNYDIELSSYDLLRTLRVEVDNLQRKVPSIVSNLKMALENPISDF